MPHLLLALAMYGFLALVAEAAFPPRARRPEGDDSDDPPARRVTPPKPRRTFPPPATPVDPDETPDEEPTKPAGAPVSFETAHVPDEGAPDA